MTQYCRYCSNACPAGDYSFYCEATHSVYSNEKAKRVNGCKDFDFNPNDLLRQNENGFAQYKPRQKKLDQVNIFEEAGV